jgi:hypothetical protein
MAVLCDFLGCLPLRTFRSFAMIESNRRTCSLSSNENKISQRWPAAAGKLWQAWQTLRSVS